MNMVTKACPFWIVCAIAKMEKINHTLENVLSTHFFILTPYGILRNSGFVSAIYPMVTCGISSSARRERGIAMR